MKVNLIHGVKPVNVNKVVFCVAVMPHSPTSSRVNYLVSLNAMIWNDGTGLFK